MNIIIIIIGFDKSFLALCAHFWAANEGVKTLLVDFIEVGSDRHTADFLRRTITTAVENLGLNMDKIFRITTDSASNFIAAFK